MTRTVFVIAWLGVLIAALAVDGPVATFVREHVSSVRPVRRVLRAFWYLGHLGTVLTVLALLCVLHAWRWRAGLLFAGSCLISAGLYAVVKWVAGRTRPFTGNGVYDFQPFAQGWRGLVIGVPNATFPSGHTTLVFAMAACLHLLIPRWGWLFYTLAGCVGVSRVLRGAHYPSDVVAAAGLGVISAWVVRICLAKRLAPRPQTGLDVIVAGGMPQE